MLSQHLSTTFGNVKGSRITKDMIQEHLGARSISDDALVAVQKLTNGDQLSPGQWVAFHNLIGQSRNVTWDNAVRQGSSLYGIQPGAWLPPDLQQSYVGSTPSVPKTAESYFNKLTGPAPGTGPTTAREYLKKRKVQ